MNKATPLTDAQLIAAIEAEEGAAYGYLSSELASQRELAMDRYLARPYGDEQDGRSQIVSSDIADAVEWVLPDLLEIFLSGDEIVRFDAKSAEDVAQAEQESDYVNNVIIERNQAFVCFNSWFKDALLQKNGYVKAFWHKTADVMLETYEGKSQEELDFILHDAEVEVIGQRSYPDPSVPPPDPRMLMQMMQQAQMSGQPPPQLPPPAMLYDVRVKRKTAREFVKFEPVPPEEVLVSVKSRTVSLQECPFVQHRTRQTISALRQMGYDIPDDIGDDTEDTMESIARDRFGEDSVRDDTHADPSMREVTFRESYLRIDRDGDGIAELRRVCIVGNTLLADEECEVVPLAAITPIIMSHRHIGMSYYDLIQDLARIKTTLLRGLLDNLYLQNNGRSAADKNTVNIEDLLISRPGGIVRTDGPPGNALMPIVTPDMSGPALQGIAYIDGVKEERTGVTKYSQGLEADVLVKTATQSSQLLTASRQRVRMIARCFAETGVKELFWLVHHLTLRHASKPEKLKLRNKWVAVNPREWVDRYDLSINVGLGTGDKAHQAMQLVSLLQMQKEGLQYGMSSMSKIRHTLGRYTQAIGFKNAEEFWNDVDPKAQPPQPPPPPEVQVAQITMQAQKELTQAQSQTKHGADMQIAGAQAETEKALAMFKAQSDQRLKEMDNANRLQIAAMQEETKRILGAHAEETKRVTAMHNAAMKVSQPVQGFPQ